jgi:hypothetical protein
MRRYCIFLALCLATWIGRADCNSRHHHHHDHGHHEHGHDHAYKFSIHQKSYRFSTVFEMDSHGNPHGSVVKSSLRWFKTPSGLI